MRHQLGGFLSMVDGLWGRLVSWLWLILRELSHTLVLDIGHIASVGISYTVGDNLSATIWKSNPVGSKGGVTIPLFILAKICTRVIVSNGILVGIDSRSVSWGCIRGWGTSSVGSGSKEKSCDESLEKMKNIIIVFKRLTYNHMFTLDCMYYQSKL